MPKARPLVERFWEKVPTAGPNECWIWLGAPDVYGYGRISVGGKGGKTLKAHRVAYELLVGPIPEGLVPGHTCHDDDESCSAGNACIHRRCVNALDHLVLMTPAENSRGGRIGSVSRARWALITHCPQGHPYSPENTYYSPGRWTSRECRICRALRMRTFKAAAKAARLSV
jgi:hypothetical protein